MEIRRIEEQDVDQFLSLWDHVFEEGEYLDKPSPPRARVKKVLARVVEDEVPNFVLLDGKILVGALEVFPASYFDVPVSNTESLGVLGMQIHRAYRGQGYGRRLLELGLVSSYEYGLEHVELDVLQTNVTAINLYKKFGFRKIEDGPRVKLPTGTVTQFQKMLLDLAA